MQRRKVQAMMIVCGLSACLGTAPVLAGQEIIETVSTSDGEESVTDDTEEVAEATLRYAKNEQEVYEALKDAAWDYIIYDEAVDYDVSSANTTADTAISAKSEASGDYSRTNVRTEGVDEGDTVKTDGKYIYTLQDDRLLIAKAAGSETEILGHITPAEETDSSSVQDILLGSQEDTVYLVCNISDSHYDENRGYRIWTNQTKLLQYDISDPAAPVKTGELLQDGRYQQARSADGRIYLYTYDSPYVGDSYEESDLAVEIGGEAVSWDHFCLPEKITGAQYLIMSAVDDADVSQITDTSVFVSGGDVYVTGDHTYVYDSYYASSSYRTQISSIAMQQGTFTAQASCRIRGSIDDTWSIDSYNGYVRVLTTYTGPSKADLAEHLQHMTSLEEYFDWYDDQRWVDHNALHILDENLERVGHLDGIAKDESVQSARYFGDRVYFVTYETTDPVFCADLSDPSDPQILSAFETTGFSAYLHPYGEGKLLGIGYETDPDTGETLGLKLSMYETAEDGSISEIGRQVISGITWSQALQDYKSLFVDADRNLIGFYQDERYFLYQFEEGDGFSRVMLYDYIADDLGGSATAADMRALYVDQELYLVGNTSIVGFDMQADYEQNLKLTVRE